MQYRKEKEYGEKNGREKKPIWGDNSKGYSSLELTGRCLPQAEGMMPGHAGANHISSGGGGSG